MSARTMAIICTCLFLATKAFPLTDVIDRVSQLEQQGNFAKAAETLKDALKTKPMAEADQAKLKFELDRLDRIKKDFPYSKDELFAELKKSVKDLTQEEYEQWVNEGRFDSREIDGKRVFMSSSVSNLFFRYPELNPRRMPFRSSAEKDKAYWDTCSAIRKAAMETRKPYVLPKRYRVTMTVTARPGAAPPGENIRAWLPIPRRYPFQEGFEFLSSSSAVIHMDGEGSPIRCVYLEQTAKKDSPTEFKIEYGYTAFGVRFDVDPVKVKAADLSDPALKLFTSEAPHVVFTPEIRALSAEIAGDEKNPYLKAKKFYDWIADRIKYSYAIEYSTIRNISDYCRTKGYGDCGQEAFLFITLCRLNGIPARWQTGWNTFPIGKTIHDWSEVYFAPYGWMPVDPYMGIYAMRYATALTAEQKLQLRDFYFGGLDQYRMAANGDHNQTLTPPKQSMRSDDVDFQRGELEWGDHNIYFDQYSWDLKWTEMKPDRMD